MRTIRFILTIILTLPTLLHAAIPDIKFRRLDTRDGLSNSQILCVFRDSKGFVWIGTPYGLNRYDGYRVKTYYSDMRDTTTLRTNYVDDIFEAYDGKLWLKQGMSYTVLDPITDKCERHPERWLEKQGITGGVEYLHIDSRKDFWVKSYNDGFFHLNPQSKKLKQFKFGYGEQEFNTDIGVSSINESGTTVFLSSNNGEILCFDRDKDVITRKVDYLRKNGLTRDQDCKMRVDLEGNVWVITQPVTYYWNPKTNQWTHTIQGALHALGFENLPEEMKVWDVLADDKHRLWIATDHGGVFVCDLRSHEIRQLLTNKYDESTISDNTLRNIYMDQIGRIWIGSYMNGANLFTGNTSSFRNLELGVINTVCYDKAGYTWLGTNDAGIMRYDNRTGESLVYDKANSGIGSNTMVGSLAATDGSVWFGTYEGGLIHIKDGQLTNYKASNDTMGLSSNNIWTVCEDQWQNIWIGTLGGGVQRIDKRTGKIRTFRISNSTLPSDYISTISRTRKGWLLVAHSKYVSLINPKTFRIVNFDITDNQDGVPITEMSIMAMEDSRGMIWQGSSSGATIWDYQRNRVYLIDMRSGLFGSTVNSIVEDGNHTMWLVTDHGISNVLPQLQENGRYTFIVRSYNNRDGLQNGPYNQRSACYTPTGLILTGGQGGLDVLNPKTQGKGRMKEVPVFSGLQLFDQDVAIGEEVDGRVLLEEALNECRQLKLRYSDQFTIQLASTSGEIHNRSRFVYKLEGFNDNWVKTSETNPNISYMSLPSGSYTLCVRMLNDDGTMGEEESQLDITIRPPFYRSWWAVLLYILTGGCLVFLWYQRTVHKNAERMELERLRRETEKQQWMNEIMAKISAGQMPVRTVKQEQLIYSPTLVDLVGFVKNTVEGFRMPEGKRAKLSFLSSLNRLTMYFDPALLRRLIEILLVNSVKYSPRDSRILVTVGETDNKAEIKVADRGLGIPEEARAHMFDPSADPNIQLYVVKQIAELHSGTVRAEDNPQGGTVFIVHLPTDLQMGLPVEEPVVKE